MRLHSSLTVDRVEKAAQSQMYGIKNPGFCIACGEDATGCEPDARNYTCEICEEKQVFGAQEIVFMLIA